MFVGEYGTSATDVIAETIWLSPEVAANDNRPLGGDDGAGGYAPLAVVTGSGASTALYWVHGNHLGVPIVTTASGAVASPTGFTMVGFPGQTRTLADLYYNRYRDYDSGTGRYIQADPIGLEGDPNPYAYAMGNPMSGSDPWGLATTIPWPALSNPVSGPLSGGYRYNNTWPYPPITPNEIPYRRNWVSRRGPLCNNPPPPPPPPDWCGSKVSGTEWVPDRILHVNIAPACKTHDRCYSKLSSIDRKKCDANLGRDILKICIKKLGGFVCYASSPIYYGAVRRWGDVSYEGKGSAE